MSINKNIVLELAPGSYGNYNRNLARNIGTTNAVFLGHLTDKYKFFQDIHGLNENDEFFQTMDEVFAYTGLTRRNQQTAIKKLTELDAITMTVRGKNPRRYFKLNFDVIWRLYNPEMYETDISECTHGRGGEQNVHFRMYETDISECTKRTFPFMNHNNEPNNEPQTKKEISKDIPKKGGPFFPSHDNDDISKNENMVDNPNESVNKKNDKNTPPPTPSPKTDFQGIVDLYHVHCEKLPRVIKLTEPRKAAMRRMAKDHTMEEIKSIFIRAGESGFLTGKNDRGWVANFDFIIKPANLIKIMEGGFDNRTPHTTGNQRNPHLGIAMNPDANKSYL